MSSGSQEKGPSEQTDREKHAELALSNKPGAPLYREYYNRRYGTYPEEDPNVDR